MAGSDIPANVEAKLTAAGVLLFNNLFEMSPNLLELFPFKDASGVPIKEVRNPNLVFLRPRSLHPMSILASLVPESVRQKLHCIQPIRWELEELNLGASKHYNATQPWPQPESRHPASAGTARSREKPCNQNQTVFLNLSPDTLQELERHALQVMTTIGRIVVGLKDISSTMEYLEELTARHVKYGVQLAHYDILVAAVLATMELALGTKWTSEESATWFAIFGLIGQAAQKAYPKT